MPRKNRVSVYDGIYHVTASSKNQMVVSAGETEIGIGNKIPLWLFGSLC